MIVSVVGLGKLGSCIAATWAKAFPVVGYDVDERKVRAINETRPPVEEPGLAEAIKENKANLSATTDLSVVADTDITFFILPTPSREDGSFTAEYLEDAVARVARAVSQKGKESHIFVCCSTTTPGDCDKLLIPLIERELSAKLGKGFFFAYNPEFIALGSVMRDLLSPDVILIGESHSTAGDVLKAMYQKIVGPNTKYRCMSVVSAELTKISVNSFVTMKISFTNQMRLIADAVGASAKDVLDAVGTDSRVGKKYLSLGMAYGGPCFPRDNRLVSFVAQKANITAPLAQATDEVNRQANATLLKEVEQHLPKGKAIAVFGLAYKPDTSITTESPGCMLAEQVIAQGHSVFVHDFCVTTECFPEGNTFMFFDDPQSLAHHSDVAVAVIAHADERYESLTFPQGVRVINCWG